MMDRDKLEEAKEKLDMYVVREWWCARGASLCVCMCFCAGRGLWVQSVVCGPRDCVLGAKTLSVKY